MAAGEHAHLEHAGEPLSAYEVRYDAADGSGKLLEVDKPTLFRTRSPRARCAS